jgi:hypothetical protein
MNIEQINALVVAKTFLNPKSHDSKPMLFLIEQVHQSSIL